MARFPQLAEFVVPMKPFPSLLTASIPPMSKRVFSNRIQETEAILAAIEESSEDAIIGKDVNGIVTSWNPAAEKMFGYPAAEIVGTPLARIIPPDRLEEAREIMARIKQGEKIGRLETV